MTSKYPYKVCLDCGLKASGGRSFPVSTYHVSTCGVCGEEKAVTEPRDFFYPAFEIGGEVVRSALYNLEDGI